MEILYCDGLWRIRLERITISIDSALATEFDQLIAARGYKNRSEAVRDLVRSHLEAQRQVHSPVGHCVANLSYVYNHHQRDLAERLTALQHGQHDLTVATLHAHLDHDNCLESVILRGATSAIRVFADTLMAQRGVRHGQLNVVAVELAGGHAHPHEHAHLHAHGAVDAAHVHLKPMT
jgi:CopG family nickel-responsive transcriptional regulator